MKSCIAKINYRIDVFTKKCLSWKKLGKNKNKLKKLEERNENDLNKLEEKLKSKQIEYGKKNH